MHNMPCFVLLFFNLSIKLAPNSDFQAITAFSVITVYALSKIINKNQKLDMLNNWFNINYINYLYW